MNDETERLLREFLAEQRQADIKGTLDRLADLYIQHDADDKVRHAELQGDIRGLSIRVGRLEKNDEKLEADVEKSGSWHIESLKEQRENAQFWNRHWPSIVSAVVAVVALAFAMWGRK